MTMRRNIPDANDNEFNYFIEYCRLKGLDPVAGEAVLVIYGKKEKDQSKRKAIVITTQAGMRVMAEKTGAYHPAKPGDTVWTYTPYELERARLLAEASKTFNIQERTARLKDINENMPVDLSNPFGLVECRTIIYKNGDPCEGIATWVEKAPRTPDPHCFEYVSTGEYWENKNGTQGNEKKRKRVRDGINPLDHMVLDTSGQWGSGGKFMLAKCATVNALQGAFPRNFGGDFHTEETTAKWAAEDRTASELAEIGEQEKRTAAIGQTTKDEYVWADNDGDVKYHPVNAFGDTVLRSARTCKFRDEYERLMTRLPNRDSLLRYWGNHKADALDVRAELEAFRDRLPNRPEAVTIEHEGVPTNA